MQVDQINKTFVIQVHVIFIILSVLEIIKIICVKSLMTYEILIGITASFTIFGLVLNIYLSYTDKFIQSLFVLNILKWTMLIMLIADILNNVFALNAQLFIPFDIIRIAVVELVLCYRIKILKFYANRSGVIDY